MSSLRSKVDAFFNPAPSREKVSAAQLLDEEGNGFDDDGDHMRSFFDKGAAQASRAETNRRTILGDIALTKGAYSGTKVSRAEIEAQ